MADNWRYWQISHRAEHRARLVADRHYNRQKIGSSQFVPPGRCIVLYSLTPTGQALWVTSWPFAEYVKHDWAGAWICSCFRNENAAKASTLITQAVASTRSIFSDTPKLGMITFIDMQKVKPVFVRGKPSYGYSYKKAGFNYCGQTKGGLLAFQLLPCDMPSPQKPLNYVPKVRING